jgi:hypothetical protein
MQCSELRLASSGQFYGTSIKNLEAGSPPYGVHVFAWIIYSPSNVIT